MAVSPVTPDSEPNTTFPSPVSTGRMHHVLGRWARRALALLAALVAAALVSLFTVDLGSFPQLKRIAEERASDYLRRPMHIGRLSAMLTPGTFALDDVVIEGRAPNDRPFFKAGRIFVHVPWWSMFRGEINIEVRLTDWEMVVELSKNGSNVPRLTPEQREPRRPGRFRTTVRYVYAQDGEFTYLDHVTPWSVVARNLSFDLVRSAPLQQYVGQARFSDGTVRIQSYEPMRTDMTTRFVLDGPRVQLQHIDLITDGSESHVSGEVWFGRRWPEQTYHVTSTVDLARMREIFFAREPWRSGGEAAFTGTFKFFRDGRELAGEFRSDYATVNDLEFPDLHGSLIWTPQRFEVTHAEAQFLGGTTRFNYSIAPLGRPGGSTATFSASYLGLDLAGLDQLINLRGLQLEGRASGSLDLQWPNGRFVQRIGTGHTVVEPPAGVVLAPAVLPDAPLPPRPEPVPFDPYLRFAPLMLGADLHYRLDASGTTFDDGWAATERTYVAFSGTLAAAGSSFPFRVTSHDWQESDRLLAGIMTAVAGPSRAIEVGGRGTFSGTMTGSFSSPRIAGRFTGDDMRAWDVTWGRASADLVIEKGYVTLTKSEVINGSGRIYPDGRYSLGFRRDDAEEIEARIRMANWPMRDLRHAFGLDDWPVDGVIGAADLALTGRYRQMFGSGQLRIDRGTAWGERFETATGELELEGTGLRISRVEMMKSTGAVRGAARIGWDGTYAFNADGRVPVESLDNFKLERMPLSGMLTFKATGASEFDNPIYVFTGTIPDFYVGDQGVGLVEGQIRIAEKRMFIERLAARSGLMDLDGRGTVSLNDAYDGALHVTFTQTSIDPYLKFVLPELSPYTRAIVSGVIDVTGPLARPREVDATATINDVTLTLFDYELRNDGPLRMSYVDERLTLSELKLSGSDTNLVLSGGADASRRVWDMAADGNASLAILQLFYPGLTASGGATLNARLTGAFDAPRLLGNAEILNGRFRPLGSPHGLEEINGDIRFGSTEINIDDISGRIGTGVVDFGGSIRLEGYRLSEYDLTARGRSMRLRYPRGFSSTVDMDLDLTGPIGAPQLTGTIDVLRVLYVGTGDADQLFGLAAAGTAGLPAPVAPSTEVTGTQLALDIQVAVPPMTLIENNTARIEGTADLRVLGTFDRPLITGSVQFTGGELTFLGNRYFVRESSIEFGGSGETTFDLAAETRPRVAGQTYNVQVRLAGSPRSITPTLTPDPWLPQAEVASLLFGGVVDPLSAEQSALGSPQEQQQRLIQTAAAALIASPISSRVGSVVERFSAIDTVQITPLLSNEAAFDQLNPTARVTLGKRVSNRVFLTYSRTLSGRQDEIILIEYDQNDRLSWVLSRNEDRTFALDFRIRYVF